MATKAKRRKGVRKRSFAYTNMPVCPWCDAHGYTEHLRDHELHRCGSCSGRIWNKPHCWKEDKHGFCPHKGESQPERDPGVGETWSDRPGKYTKVIGRDADHHGCDVVTHRLEAAGVVYTEDLHEFLRKYECVSPEGRKEASP